MLIFDSIMSSDQLRAFIKRSESALQDPNWRPRYVDRASLVIELARLRLVVLDREAAFREGHGQ